VSGYLLKSARYLAQEALERAILPGDHVVDATAGNGHDTEFLCRLVGESGRVYAFDLQESAIESTRVRLMNAGLLDRATLIHTGHEAMAEHVRAEVSAVVFNLGWLPGGDHTVTTRWETTRTAVEAALGLLKPGGVITICAYPGHDEGERERQELIAYLSALDNRQYNVLEQRFLNAGSGAPECFIVQKIGKGNTDESAPSTGGDRESQEVGNASGGKHKSVENRTP